MSECVLEMKEIYKSFAVPVLKGVDFSLKKGEVHALVGGNGAGKSTLMKIMTGVYTMDSGEIFIGGRKADIKNTGDAKKNRIAMIFQELSLVPTMTVAENIFLGEELTCRGIRKSRLMNEQAEQVCQRLGIQVGVKERIESLGVGMCQMIEIAKAVAKDARILILDEPTASLSAQETKQLFGMIRDLQQKGVSMVYISHRMSEILEIADSITILRDGGIVHTGPTKGVTLDKIIRHMLGGNNDKKKFAWIERKIQGDGSQLLKVEHLKVNEQIADISFFLKKGEILGLAGLMGSGRTEILETLFGIRKKQGGTVRLHGRAVTVKNPRQAVAAGFALIPEDRRRQGLVLIHSVKENAVLPKIGKIRKYKLFVDEKSANAMVAGNVSSLGIVTDDIHKRINLLSGGNQQKVVVAKWLNMNPEIMMLDEPTAGVDIGAKAEIIDLMRDFADSGKGVLFVSSELTELLAVCDRILVLFDGVITGELDRKEIQSEEELQYAIQKK